jgi:hypothetical protein
MEPTPRSSRSSSTASSRSKPNLSIDISAIPPLTPPTPPSNTLLLTNITNPEAYQPVNLAAIRIYISQIAPIHTFAPLKSFGRIFVSFYDVESATKVRRQWEGKAVHGDRCKVYFGQNTPLHTKDEHLALPDAGKLFFISPPPSPPHGWEVRMEDAPNKLVHADDLAAALAKLNHSRPESAGAESPLSPADGASARGSNGGSFSRPTRSRSSTLIYQPDDKSPNMPAVVVEDMTDEPLEMSPVESTRPILAHTARPPVELMLDA